jgi:hypothetical protein
VTATSGLRRLKLPYVPGGGCADRGQWTAIRDGETARSSNAPCVPAAILVGGRPVNTVDNPPRCSIEYINRGLLADSPRPASHRLSIQEKHLELAH